MARVTWDLDPSAAVRTGTGVRSRTVANECTPYRTHRRSDTLDAVNGMGSGATGTNVVRPGASSGPTPTSVTRPRP